MSEVPRNWVMSSVGEVFNVVGGGTPSTSQPDFWGSGHDWITSADILGVRQLDPKRKVTAAGVANSPVTIVPPQTILVVTRVGLGKVAVADRPLGFSQDVQGLMHSLNALEPSFSLHYLSFALERLKFSGRGTTISGITKKQLSDTKFPIPPLAEQRRIVAKIEELFSELDKGVESLTTAREQLKAYRQSVLKHAFEGKLTARWRAANKKRHVTREVLQPLVRAELSSECDPSLLPQVPPDWVTAPLGSLDVEIFDGPFGSNLKTSDYVSYGVRVIRLENIGYGRFVDEKRSYVSQQKYETLQRHTVRPNDIVFSSFVTDAIRSTLVPPSVEFAINKADCFAIRFGGNVILSEFAQAFLESRNAYKQVEGMIHGVGRPRINTTQLKQIVFPICSISEQAEIVKMLGSITSEIDEQDAGCQTQLTRVTALRQAILKRAFEGKLVAQDRGDEPASTLLQRIQAEQEHGGLKKAKNGKKEAA